MTMSAESEVRRYRTVRLRMERSAGPERRLVLRVVADAPRELGTEPPFRWQAIGATYDDVCSACDAGEPPPGELGVRSPLRDHSAFAR